MFFVWQVFIYRTLERVLCCAYGKLFDLRGMKLNTLKSNVEEVVTTGPIAVK